MCEQFFKRHEKSQQIPFISLILQCLLICSGDAINQPDENDKGNRLLHKSVSLSCLAFRLLLTKVLLTNGAHFDAVNALGSSFISNVDPSDELFQDICSSYLPLPLTCLSATTIIAEGIQYKLVDLPKHVIDFIALHDTKNATKKPFIDIEISSLGVPKFHEMCPF